MREDSVRMIGHADDIVNKAEVDKAISSLSRLIALDPDDYDAYMRRGAIHLLLGDAEPALADFDKAIALHPGEYLMYLNRAYAHLALRHWPEAEADANTALDVLPAEQLYYRCDALISRATARREMDQLTESLEDFNAALAIRPTALNALLSRAALFCATKNWEAAFADINRAKKALPNNPLSYYFAASVYVQQGNGQAAIKELRRAFVLDPTLVFQAASEEEFATLRENPATAEEFRRLIGGDDKVALSA